MPLRVSLAALLLLALSGLAFWRPYLSAPQAAGAHVHAHALLGVAWLVLMAVQPLLIRASRRAAHRQLGRIGAALGGAFVLSGVLVAHRGLARMGAEQFALEGRLVYLPLVMAALFAAALTLALVWRASPAVHARFMAATLLPLLDPVTARLLYFYGPRLPFESGYQVPAFSLVALALALMARSLPERAPGRASFIAFVAGALVALAGFFVVPDTEPWLAFAAWFRALPMS